MDSQGTWQYGVPPSGGPPPYGSQYGARPAKLRRGRVWYLAAVAVLPARGGRRRGVRRNLTKLARGFFYFGRKWRVALCARERANRQENRESW
jgi:hypothetical protein